MEIMRIIIVRQRISYDYKYSAIEIEERQMNNYQANTRNNMLDSLRLVNNGIILFESHNVQTVSNHPMMKYRDTIKAGEFQIKCFVENAIFNTQIHGIINAYDISGQPIDEYSKQYDNGQYIGRWLIHSSYYKPLGKDTKAYSGGCIVMSTNDLLALNRALIKEGIKSNDIINAFLEEI
jgi:hypothetical protein